MKAFRKSRINAAIAAMVGLAATAGVVEAQTVERTGTGQALIFPYYTVNDGWVTTFNATNTSGNTLAVKFRLRESKNSRDVLDFNVVMSPYDVWTAWVVKDPDTGKTRLYTADESCTSPTDVRDSLDDGADPILANPIAYSGSQADGGGSEDGRLRDGYIEMLVMGETDTIDTPPRDFDPAIGDRPDVYLYSIDDLQAACERNRQARDKHLPAAERIIEGPPMSIFSIASANETSGWATVASKG